MDIEGIKMIAAAVAVLPLFGVGLALGNLFSTLLSSIARNPSAKDELWQRGFFGFVMIETIAIFALGVSFLILFK